MSTYHTPPTGSYEHECLPPPPRNTANLIFMLETTNRFRGGRVGQRLRPGGPRREAPQGAARALLPVRRHLPAGLPGAHPPARQHLEVRAGPGLPQRDRARAGRRGEGGGSPACGDARVSM